MRVSVLALTTGLALTAFAPRDAAAQLSGRERSEQANRGGVVVPQGRQDSRTDGRRDGRCYDDDRYDRRRHDERDDRHRANAKHKSRDHRARNDRYDDCDQRYRMSRTRNGKGPQFCRNGQGHPVYGMAWCRQKGWQDVSLRNTGWGDVILRRPRVGAQSDLGRSALEQILGAAVYGRFDQQRARLGLGSSLTGRWMESRNGSLLNLFASGIQLAQIVDRNRDGRADVVLLNYGR